MFQAAHPPKASKIISSFKAATNPLWMHPENLGILGLQRYANELTVQFGQEFLGETSSSGVVNVRKELSSAQVVEWVETSYLRTIIMSLIWLQQQTCSEALTKMWTRFDRKPSTFLNKHGNDLPVPLSGASIPRRWKGEKLHTICPSTNFYTFLYVTNLFHLFPIYKQSLSLSLFKCLVLDNRQSISMSD